MAEKSILDLVNEHIVILNGWMGIMLIDKVFKRDDSPYVWNIDFLIKLEKYTRNILVQEPMENGANLKAVIITKVVCEFLTI